MAHLVIGARGDALAVKQANQIKAQLEHAHAGLQVGLEILPGAATDQTAWLEEATTALFERRVDVIAHHLCDLSARLPEDFHLAAVTERGDARDALIVREEWRGALDALADLPAQARVVAEGWQRRTQIAAQQPDVCFVDGYGALEIELQKLAAGEFDALVTDVFSLSLLGAQAQIAVCLDASEFIPAAGQGALALQSRLADQRTNLLLEALNHAPTRFAVSAERAALRNLYGEPGDAIAVTATLTVTENQPQLTLLGLVGDATLTAPVQLIRGTTTGDPRSPDLLGSALAVQLLNAGARALLNHSRVAQAVAAQADTLESLYPSFADRTEDDHDFESAEMPEAARAATMSSAASAFRGLGARPAVLTALPARQALEAAAFSGAAFPEFELVAARALKLRQQQPLHDQRILLAAATRNYDELAKRLESLGATVCIAPRLRATEPASWEALDKALLHVSWYDWLVFANAASVAACLKRCDTLGHQRQELEARRLCAIGKATADTLKAAGLQADLVLPRFTAEALAPAWEKRFGPRAALRGQAMLLLTTQNFAHEFAHASRLPLRVSLDQLGVYVEAVATHRHAPPAATTPQALTDLLQASFDYALFFDAASFENLAALCEPRRLAEALAAARVVCLSDSAHETALAHGLTAPRRAPETATRAVVKWLREDCAR